MLRFIKAFLKEEDGMGTVEIILIIAVLVAIALIFRAQIMNFVSTLIEKIFPNPNDPALDNSKLLTSPKPTP